MKKKHKRAIIFFAVVAALVIAVLAEGLRCSLTIGLTRISVQTNKLAPQSVVRIAQVSDLHNAQFGEGNKRLLKKLEEAEADIIAITGDIADAHKTDIDVALDFAKNAVKIAPCYYVAGNHEAVLGQDFEELEAGLKNAGVTVLRDEISSVETGSVKINIAGLYDPMFDLQGDALERTPKMFKRKLDGIITDLSVFTVLLSHRPEQIEAYSESSVDLVLAGHAHGGQFRLPFIGGVVAPNQGFFPKYDAGLYESGSTKMVVSRGLGNSVIPLRINNRAEIVVIEIEGK